MQFKPSLVASLLLSSSFIAAMAQAAPTTTSAPSNCGASYYCYKSMTPGPISTPDTTRINKLAAASVSTARPTTPPPATPRTQTPAPRTQASVPNRTPPAVTNTRPAAPATPARPPLNRPDVISVITSDIPSVTPATTRVTTTPSTTRVTVTPARRPNSASTSSSSVATRTASAGSVTFCNELKAKLAEVERQATAQSRSGDRDKAKSLFKIASDLRNEAKSKTCTL
ncbi:hypothetical protein [Thiolinea disciformis]|uniref:hypothetical protein n=1 Tax=Thiolinea disciformis TaxID=125614 RepID=UPI0003819311|nr:hypothetical protein [Thiolinea disciformis]